MPYELTYDSPDVENDVKRIHREIASIVEMHPEGKPISVPLILHLVGRIKGLHEELAKYQHCTCCNHISIHHKP